MCIWIVLLGVSAAFIVLGAKALSGNGLALTRSTTLAGTPAKIVGILCLVAGLGLIPIFIIAIFLGTRGGNGSGSASQAPPDIPARTESPDDKVVASTPAPNAQLNARKPQPRASNPKPRQLLGPSPPPDNSISGQSPRATPAKPPAHPPAQDTASPKFRPVPGNPNIAVWAPRSYQKYTPELAFDGNPETLWNAGGWPEQFIEMDLKESKALTGIKLTMPPGKSKPGETIHEIWVSDQPIGVPRTDGRLVHTFRGVTNWGDELQADFPSGTSGRYVQIRSTKSASWIAWGEIDIRTERN